MVRLLDLTGLLCPDPVMALHEAVDAAAAGDVLEVLATDPTTRRDIPRFCRHLGHALLDEQEVDGQFSYRIRVAGHDA
jgi:tRNA 2-thiouridine synthesizing protein A